MWYFGTWKAGQSTEDTKEECGDTPTQSPDVETAVDSYRLYERQ